jgi:hypothetical protein
MCIPVPLIGNSWVKYYRGNEYICRNRRLVGGVVFYAVRVISRESIRLVLPRTSWFNIWNLPDFEVCKYYQFVWFREINIIRQILSNPHDVLIRCVPFSLRCTQWVKFLVHINLALHMHESSLRFTSTLLHQSVSKHGFEIPRIHRDIRWKWVTDVAV